MCTIKGESYVRNYVFFSSYNIQRTKEFFVSVMNKKKKNGAHFLINLKTRAVAPFFLDARTFHNSYKLQKHVLLRHQSYLIVFMGNKNLRFWQIIPL